ncbi:MAG: hypothetical protein LAT75_14355, partial [Candidatus Cyclonatronum sp.]|uniref:hypothetical protein n=1 Tax=Cyclonatronum sp. TaxID=3024185 RepID=UPI0025BF72C9
QLNEKIEEMQALFQAFAGDEINFGERLETAEDLLLASAEYFENLAVLLSESPLTILQPMPVPALNTASTLVFNLDEELASEQMRELEEMQSAVIQLDNLYRESISAVELNLNLVESLMYGQAQSETNGAETVPENSLMELFHGFGETVTLFETYFAEQAQQNWGNVRWAGNLRRLMAQNRSGIIDPIRGSRTARTGSGQETVQLTNLPFYTLHYYYNNNARGNWEMIHGAFRMAQRVYFLDLLFDESFNLIHASPMFFDSNYTFRYFDYEYDTQRYVPTYRHNVGRAGDIYREFKRKEWDQSLVSTIQQIEETSHRNFWYYMHYNGLGAYMESYLNWIESGNVDDDKQARAADLFSNMHSITALADDFYRIQTQLTSVLWDLNNNYVEWRREIDRIQTENDGGSEDLLNIETDYSEYIANRTRLSEMLMPPVISTVEIQLNSQPDAVFTEAEIRWTANHGHKITETSFQYNVDGQTGSGGLLEGLNEYFTLGLDPDQAGNTGSVDGSITLMPVVKFGERTETGFLTEDPEIDFGIRVRGAAGTTAVRRGSLRVATGFSGGISTGPGAGGGSVTVPVPPSSGSGTGLQRPHIILSNTYNHESRPIVFTFFTSTQSVYFTSNSQFIRLTIDGYDSSHNINLYEYAIGTVRGGTDVLGWTELQGERINMPEIPSQRMIGNTQFLSLNEGVQYFISARVTNANGQLSPVQRSNHPIIYDGTKPDAPQLSHLPQVPVISSVTPVETRRAVSAFVPQLTIPDMEQISSPFFEPVLRFSGISASDNLSGILGYEYAVSNDPDNGHVLFDAGEYTFHTDSELLVEGGRFDEFFNSFTDEMWLHIRAVDLAGNRSDITTRGPFLSDDPSAPFSGKMTAKVDPQDIKLYLTEVPFDPESDVTGIQYQLVSRSYTYSNDGKTVISYSDTVLRSFPAGTGVDLDWNLQKSADEASGSQQHQRFLSVSKDGLPVGDDLYLQYRSVNAHGSLSEVRESGPINLDTTPPTGTASASFSNLSFSRLGVDINANNIQDLESGVVKVVFSFPGSSNSTTFTHTRYFPRNSVISNINWRSPSFSEFVLARCVEYPYSVRVYNGAGLVTTISGTIMRPPARGQQCP